MNTEKPEGIEAMEDACMALAGEISAQVKRFAKTALVAGWIFRAEEPQMWLESILEDLKSYRILKAKLALAWYNANPDQEGKAP